MFLPHALHINKNYTCVNCSTADKRVFQSASLRPDRISSDSMAAAFSSTSSWARPFSAAFVGAFPLPAEAPTGCFFCCVFFGGAAFPAVTGLLTGFGAVLPAETFPLALPTPCSDLAGAVHGRSFLGTFATITALSQHSFICYKESTYKQHTVHMCICVCKHRT